jgi:plasmid stabilization system protein ParE
VKYRVHVTARAEADIDEAYSWYADQSVEAAARWHDELSRAIASLERFQERSVVAAAESEAFGVEVRRQVVGRYNVFLHLRGRTVYILTVRHGARKRLSKDRQR